MLSPAAAPPAGPLYALCGLPLVSGFPLPELPLWTGPDTAPQIVVRLGEVPDRLPSCLHHGPVLQVAPGAVCRFEIAGVASFLIEDGRQITVQTRLPPEAPDIRLFLLGSVFGLLCHQRGWLPLHACCVEIDGAAIACTGPSGMGKSTLAACFLQQGFRLLADDVTVIDADAPGGPVVIPAFARLRLWRDSLQALGIPPDGLEPCRDRLDKFQLPVSAPFRPDPLPLAAVYHLERVTDPRLAGLAPLTGLPAVQELLGAVYRQQAAERMGRKPQMLRAIHRLLAVPGLSLRYPPGLERLGQTVAGLATRHRRGGV